MKILIHSNAPYPMSKTGYGVQCALLAERLHDAGHDVAISATYGQQGAPGVWKPEKPRRPELWDKPIRVYQCGWQVNGLDIIHNHAYHFFGGDPLGGWVLPLLDVWALTENTLLADFNVLAWTPVDHFPTPPGVLQFFERSGAVPVAMSQFGERALETSGLDVQYAPLAVDLNDYRPLPAIVHPEHGELTGRDLIGCPDEAFLVGMVAMNKDPGDRKGFNEAFAAFGAFWRTHNDARLYVHSDWKGMGTSFDLRELAIACGVPEHALLFPDTYAYQTGFTSEMMAAIYTSMDVLLAPSHGEGFCVPLIEAQACGTPVIVTDFSAQPELVGAGWKVMGQQQWDPAQHAFYIVPYINEILDALQQAYVADLDEMATVAVNFAALYDADRVFAQHWLPLLDQMEAKPEPLLLERTEPFAVAVIVPAMRKENIARIRKSFDATNDGTAKLLVVADAGFVDDGLDADIVLGLDATPYDYRETTYAEKVNEGFRRTDAPWVFLCGDDVEFHPGWLEQAAKWADTFDVIGTNDSLPGRVRNPNVAKGTHADHFFVRRAYVDAYGSSLEGPGVLAPECYGHFFVDKEIVELAKARGVFAPCLESVVEHHHPAYDGLPRDDVYNQAVDQGKDDQDTYKSRLPLIKMQRTSLGKFR